MEPMDHTDHSLCGHLWLCCYCWFYCFVSFSLMTNAFPWGLTILQSSEINILSWSGYFLGSFSLKQHLQVCLNGGNGYAPYSLKYPSTPNKYCCMKPRTCKCQVHWDDLPQTIPVLSSFAQAGVHSGLLRVYGNLTSEASTQILSCSFSMLQFNKTKHQVRVEIATSSS